MKQCSTCKQLRPVTEFHKSSKAPDGLQPRCKACKLEVNRDRRLAQHRKHAAENREANRAYSRDYRRRNREKLLAIQAVKRSSKREQYTASEKVNLAVNRGELPAAKSLYCCRCHEQAAHYHHQSYLPDDRLNVLPLCNSCHRRIDKGGMEIVFSGFAYKVHPVGMLRIGIAGLP